MSETLRAAKQGKERENLAEGVEVALASIDDDLSMDLISLSEGFTGFYQHQQWAIFSAEHPPDKHAPSFLFFLAVIVSRQGPGFSLGGEGLKEPHGRIGCRVDKPSTEPNPCRSPASGIIPGKEAKI